ncbi:hypothetical protein ZEAMMB73_Zm00001d035319 [Zea mays]|uniref:Uncharacterized protein n=1 Tax=Zea mays TaxID=4577 RepID=A0A1D6LFF8_MAIZE|nr:hypothetical protein ZEAMMB73_Zm00001d035319 [Zea mays]
MVCCYTRNLDHFTGYWHLFSRPLFQKKLCWHVLLVTPCDWSEQFPRQLCTDFVWALEVWNRMWLPKQGNRLHYKKLNKL